MTFQRALNALSFDPLIARVFASLPESSIAKLSDWYAANDPYQESAATARALDVVGADRSVVSHVRHQLWCAWREAGWKSASAAPLTLRVIGQEWLRETENHPTLLVCPMTLGLSDSLHAIASLSRGRRCAVFGESVEDTEATHGLEIITGETPAAARRIRAILDANGVLCTYVDFVYSGHVAETIRLFGAPRPVSSGFLSLAARNNTMLLPILCVREGEGIVVHISEPSLIRIESREPSLRDAARDEVVHTIGCALEDLLRVAAEQWLLLPTLTFESPQMSQAHS